jgi:hypothetical protein
VVGQPSALAFAARKVGIGLVETVQPTKDVRDPVADLSSDSNAGRAAAICAEIVNGLYVHTEIFGEFACGEDGLEAEPGEALGVHDS